MVAHYIEGIAEQVGKYYFPVHRMDGSQVEGLNSIDQGGPCGVPIFKDGKLMIEMGAQSAEVAGPH